MSVSEIFKNTWSNSLSEAAEVHEAFSTNSLQIESCIKFSQILVAAFQNGNNVFSCGNGGSHCDAMHFAEEFTGRYRKERRPLGALALGDASHMSCVSNDYGFEFVYSRQLEALAKTGDVLVLLSTSGQSKNLIEAVRVAKTKAVTTVGLLGRDGGALKDIVDLAIVVNAQTSDRIQEMHIKIIHTVIESVERVLFPENYR